MPHDIQQADPRPQYVTDIVVAYLGNNPVAAGDLQGLIASVRKAIYDIGGPPKEVAPPPPPKVYEPAVPVSKSVSAKHVTCLECGIQLKMLKRHLSAEHDLTPAEYFERYDLPSDHPLVSLNYSGQRSKLAHEHGLGVKAPIAD